MIYFTLTVFFIFSVVIGSFLNVVIYRYNTGLSVSKGRSKCFSCNTTLQPKDLVPIFSYIYNKGRCAYCKTPISIQYPAVELLTGILLTSIFYMYFFSANSASFIGMYMFDIYIVPEWLHMIFFIIDLNIASLLIAVGIYDIRHKIIPDGLVYTAAIFSFLKMLIALLVLGNSGIISFMFDISSGLLTALPFALLWLVSGGRWMGLGDAKLALVLGWVLGIGNGFTAIVYSFWIGCIVALGIMLLRELVEIFSDKNNTLHIKLFKSKTSRSIMKYLPMLKLKSEMPFGPYMIIGLYAVYFSGKTLFSLL